MLEEYKDVINVSDLCSILGICRNTAYQLLEEGDFKYRRIGGVYKIRKDSVVSFLSDESDLHLL